MKGPEQLKPTEEKEVKQSFWEKHPALYNIIRPAIRRELVETEEGWAFLIGFTVGGAAASSIIILTAQGFNWVDTTILHTEPNRVATFISEHSRKFLAGASLVSALLAEYPLIFHRPFR